MTQPANILLVDDDRDLLQHLSIRLETEGYKVTASENAEKALAQVAISCPQLIITDLRMSGMDGMVFQKTIQTHYPAVPVIILTAHGTIPEAVKATKQGAFNFLTKPFDAHHLLRLVSQAIELNETPVYDPPAPQQDGWRDAIVTRSPLMEDLISRLKRVADSDVSVLISGESGTGKELLARAVHHASPRAGHPFLAINCGAIPEHLLESELFGHNKGAFTGATSTHQGLFVAAHGGTLFLDEIGDMPPSLQSKLLRVLQEREVRPVGSTRTIPVDIRLVSATHRNLEQAMTSGHFREDLYYRLKVVTLEVPSLQERREDIPLLVRHFLARIGERTGKRAAAFSPEAMRLMINAPWPGNIRQLHNLVEQVAVLASTPIIPATLVEKALRGKPSEFISLAEARSHFERRYLAQLLKITAGNVSEAARMAKRNRTEFYRLLQRHQLEPAIFKAAVGSSD